MESPFKRHRVSKGDYGIGRTGRSFWNNQRLRGILHPRRDLYQLNWHQWENGRMRIVRPAIDSPKCLLRSHPGLYIVQTVPIDLVQETEDLQQGHKHQHRHPKHYLLIENLPNRTGQVNRPIHPTINPPNRHKHHEIGQQATQTQMRIVPESNLQLHLKQDPQTLQHRQLPREDHDVYRKEHQVQ